MKICHIHVVLNVVHNYLFVFSFINYYRYFKISYMYNV